MFLWEILIDLRRSLCQPFLHDPRVWHKSLGITHQVMLRLHNDRGQVPYKRYHTIMNFNTFSACSKSPIKSLIKSWSIHLLGLTLPDHQRRCVRSSASLRHSGWTHVWWAVCRMSLMSQRPSFIHGPTVSTPLCRITSETPYDASVKSWKICVRTFGNFTKVCLGMNSHQILRPLKVQTFRKLYSKVKVH